MRRFDSFGTRWCRYLLPSLIIAFVAQASNAEDIGADSEIAKELERLEKSFSDQISDLGDDISAIADDKSIVHSGSSKATMKVVGRVHIDYWGFPQSEPGIDALEGGPDGPQDRLNFRRMRFGVRGDLPSNMEYRIEMEFAGGNNSEFRDAWLGWKELPVLQKLLIGNQKRPYGYDHLNSSRFNVFIERPFVIETFNEDARRPGLTMYGQSDDEKYIWAYGAYFLENLTRDGRTIGDSRQMSVNGRIATSPWYDEASGGRGYFHFALSGMWGFPDADAGAIDQSSNEGRFRTRPEARSSSRWLDTGRIAGIDNYAIAGVESILNVGPMQLVGEYQVNSVQRDSGFEDTMFHGGYVYLSYFLTGEHIPYSRSSGTVGRVKPFENFFLVDTCDGGRGHGWGALNVALRYSYLDISDADVLGGVGESVTLGLNWWWTPYSRLQFNLIYGDIDQRNVAGVTSGDYVIAGARFAVDF